jgi:DNA mismatch repair protein MutL
MGKIALIQGFEKIAAGEVIERPASVVKELVENAIDAKAIHITINIEKAGKALIQIIDDGTGIAPDDIEIAFQRHTSSKISTADDLDKLNTLGFRGEALASIAAVSELEIISRIPNLPTGMKLQLVEGKKISLDECGAPVGTNLQIKNLFFNLPVRQKFLRSDRIELGHISDIISRYTLAYPHIHFKLVHNGLVLLNAPEWVSPTDETITDNTKQKLPLDAYGHAIQNIYGKKTLDQMIPIEFSDDEINLYGYIGLPDVARSERVASSLFVNQRLVVNQGIADIMENAYRDYLMRQKYPFYVLFVDVPPASVDFNVHPSKKIVKFVQEDQFMERLQVLITDLVKSKFKKALQTNNSQTNNGRSIETVMDYWTPATPPPLPQKTEKADSTKNTHNNIPNRQNSQSRKITPYNETFKSGSRPSLPIKKTQRTLLSENQTTSDKEQVKEINSMSSTIENQKEDNLFSSDAILTRQLPPLKFLNTVGQAGETYLIFQNEQGLVIIDQHAADERINYEKVQQLMTQQAVPIQKLVVPIKMEIAAPDVEFVKEASPQLIPYGFEIDHFGGTTFLIRSIPAFIKNANQPLLITDMCHQILTMGKNRSLSEIKREIIQYMACHKSIRAGDPIWTRERVRKLILELDKMDNPHHCAHGRPTYISITFEELEKMFHRRL